MGGRHWSEISFFLFFLFKGVIPWASDVLSQRLYFKEKNRNNNTFTPWVVKWKNDETLSPDSWLGIVPFFFFLIIDYLFIYFIIFIFLNLLMFCFHTSSLGLAGEACLGLRPALDTCDGPFRSPGTGFQ